MGTGMFLTVLLIFGGIGIVSKLFGTSVPNCDPGDQDLYEDHTQYGAWLDDDDFDAQCALEDEMRNADHHHHEF